MPTKSIEARLASKLEAQKKLGEEIAALKRAQAQKAKAERQRVERQLGRLAIHYGFDQWPQEALQAAFETLVRERHQQHPTGRGAHRGDDRVPPDEA